LIIGYGDDLQDAGIQFCLLNRDNSAAYHGSSGLYWKDDGDNQGVGHCYGYVSGGWHRLVDLVYPTVTTSNVPEGGPSVAFAVLPGDVTSGTTYITFTPDPGNLPVMSANATRAVALVTSPKYSIQNGKYTYAEFVFGDATDENGTNYPITWTEERVCNRSCHPDGVMRATFSAVAGHTYTFHVTGTAVVPDTITVDAPAYTFQAQ